MAVAGKTRTYQREYARHLDEPLLTDKVDFYAKHPSVAEARFPTIPSSAFISSSQWDALPSPLLVLIQHHLETQFALQEGYYHLELKTIIETVTDVLNIQAQGLNKLGIALDTVDLSQLARTVSSNLPIYADYHKKCCVKELHNVIQTQAQTGVALLDLNDTYGFALVDDLVYFPKLSHFPLVVPYSFLLCVLDKIESQFSIRAYSLLANESDVFKGMNFYNANMTLYETLDNAYLRFGNESMHLMKIMEPLCVGVILEYQKDEGNSREFLDLIISDFTHDHPRMASMLQLVLTLMKKPIQDYGDRGVRQTMEYYGQEKMHFYPIIDKEIGLTKMREAGSEVGTFTLSKGQLACGEFVKQYILRYHEKEGRLPPIYLSSSLNPSITQMYESKVIPSRSALDIVPNTDWASVVFKSHHAFNYYPNVMDLLDDKAIAPSRSKLNQIYVHDVLKVNKLSSVPNKDYTRLILALLNRQSFSIEELFAQVNSLQRIPHEWTLILLRMKEKELKVGGRPFSILTLEARMMASVLERNLAESILPLFNTQTITDSGPHLKSKLDSLMTLKSDIGKVWVYFHMDFSNWNYTFRPPMVQPFLSKLDQIFGTSCYKWSWKIFTSALLVSYSRFEPQGTQQYINHWSSHLGGNQGICQKLWTLITQSIIMEVMKHHGYQYLLIGSGDNQIMAVNMMVSPTLEQSCQDLVSALTTAFHHHNLQLKREETWYSTSLFCYQRKYYYKKVALDIGNKHANKAFAGTSDLDTGIASQIATSMQSGISLVESTVSPFIGPFYAMVEALCTVLHHLVMRRTRPLYKDELKALCFIPSDLGGLPFLLLSQFLYTGHKDVLTEVLALYNELWIALPSIRGLLTAACQITLSTNVDENKERLILNPHTVCQVSPVTAEILIKNYVESELRNNPIIRNVQVKEMIGKVQKTDIKKLITMLFRIQPIHLSLVHQLFEVSAEGMMLSTLNRFTTVSSLVNFTNLNRIRQGEKTYRDLLNQCDSNLMHSLRIRLMPSTRTYPDLFHALLRGRYPVFQEFCQVNQFNCKCTFALRLFLTSLAAGTLPTPVLGPFTPAPLEQLSGVVHPSLLAVGNVLIVEPASNIPTNRASLASTRGPFPMYIGSATKDPVKSIRLVNLEHIQAGPAIKMLMKVLGWMRSLGADQPIITELEDQINRRVPGLEAILPFLSMGALFGTFMHRFVVPGESMGAYQPSRSLVPTWYRVSSNRATMFQKGEDDYYLFFQQIYQFIYSVLRVVPPQPDVFALGININCCTYEVPPVVFKLDGASEFQLGQVIGPMVLPSHSSEALAAEAQFKLNIDQIGSVQKFHPIPGLAAVLAFQAIQPITLFNQHKMRQFQSAAQSTGPQTILNITNMRKVGISLFLKALIVQLAFCETLGPGMGPGEVLRHLQASLSRNITLSRVDAFHHVVEGIITSGGLEDLSRMSGHKIPRSELCHGSGPLVIIFQACVNILSGMKLDQEKFPFLLQVSSDGIHPKRVWNFLRTWKGKSDRQWLKTTKGADLDQILKACQNHSILDIYLTHDYNMVYEKARRLLHSDPKENARPVVKTEHCSSYLLPATNPPNPWYSISHMMVAQQTGPEVAPPIIPPTKSGTLAMEGFPKTIYQLARPGILGSSGFLKLHCILCSISDVPQAGEHAICLAEGSGSFLSLLLHRYPEMTGVYNSLHQPEEFPHSLSGYCWPTDCVCPCQISKRIVNWDQIGTTSGNLCDASVWEDLSQYVTKSVWILTWDMEGIGTDKTRALNFLLKHFAKWQPRVLVIKLFISELMGDLKNLLSSIINHCATWDLVKPAFSNPLNDEVYLVGTGYIESLEPRFLSLTPLDVVHAFKRHGFSTAKGQLGHIVAQLHWASAHIPSGSLWPSVKTLLRGDIPAILSLLTREIEVMLDVANFQYIHPHSTTKAIHSMLFGQGKARRALEEETIIIWTCTCITLMYRDYKTKKPGIFDHVALLTLFLEEYRSTISSIVDKMSHPLAVRQFWSILGVLVVNCEHAPVNDVSRKLYILHELSELLPWIVPLHTSVDTSLSSVFKSILVKAGEQSYIHEAKIWNIKVIVCIMARMRIWLAAVAVGGFNMVFHSKYEKLWLEEFPFPTNPQWEPEIALEWLREELLLSKAAAGTLPHSFVGVSHNKDLKAVPFPPNSHVEEIIWMEKKSQFVCYFSLPEKKTKAPSANI